VLPVLPEEIYKTGVSTCRMSSRRTRSSKFARTRPRRENRAHVFRHFVSALSHDGLVCADHQHGQGDRHFDFHSPDGYQRNAAQIPEESRRGAEPDRDARRKGDGARPDARHRVLRPRAAARFAAAGAGAHFRSRSLPHDLRQYARRNRQSRIEVRSILESRLVYIRPALFQQEQGFRSSLPLATDELDVHTKLNSAPLSSIFPFISFDLTSDRGILYGINRHNSSLILFDRFSLENYNSVTFAKSGAANPTTKLEILRSLMFDTEVIVIDPEREYEYLAETVGGRYFNISLSSEHHINPFDLPIPREDENPGDVLRNNIITLVGLFRIMLGGLTPEEDAIIDKAITETYALKDITPMRILPQSSRRFFPTSNSCSPAWKARILVQRFRNTPRARGPAL
jgi:hypothetical protein